LLHAAEKSVAKSTFRSVSALSAGFVAVWFFEADKMAPFAAPR